MPEIAELLAFIKAVFWKNLPTILTVGGPVIAFNRFCLWLAGHPVSIKTFIKWALIIGGGAGIFAATFMAWDDEYTAHLKLEKEKAAWDEAKKHIDQKDKDIVEKNQSIQDLKYQLREKERDNNQLQDRLLEKDRGIASLKGQEQTARLEANRLKEQQQRKPESKISINVLRLPQGNEPPYDTKFIFVPNQDITPVQVLVTCDTDIIQASASIIGASTSMGGKARKSPNSYFLEINSPVWTDLTPLIVTVKSNNTSPSCKFKFG